MNLQTTIEMWSMLVDTLSYVPAAIILVVGMSLMITALSAPVWVPIYTVKKLFRK